MVEKVCILTHSIILSQIERNMHEIWLKMFFTIWIGIITERMVSIEWKWDTIANYLLATKVLIGHLKTEEDHN